MVFFQRIMIAVVALSLVGCASKNVDWDYDPGRSLSHLHTYIWMDNDKDLEKSGYHSDALMGQRVYHSVNSIMQARGYRLVSDKKDADFLVNYKTDVQGRVEGRQITSSFGYGYGHGRWGHGIGISNDNLISEYDERTLTIDFIDPKSKDVIWRGQSRTRVQNKLSPQQRTERINQEIINILSGFPQPVK